MPPSTYYAVLLALVLGVGCVSAPTAESVIGEYGGKNYDKRPMTLVFLVNGAGRSHEDGEEHEEYSWKIVDGEIHFYVQEDNEEFVLRVEPGGDLTVIAEVIKGKRENFLKDKQLTFKIIK